MTSQQMLLFAKLLELARSSDSYAVTWSFKITMSSKHEMTLAVTQLIEHNIKFSVIGDDLILRSWS